MKIFTKSEIRKTSVINADAKTWALENLEYLNRPMNLFGSSIKVEKGADKFDTSVMYLQPADKVAARTLCAFADAAGCKKDCLISSGHLGMTAGQNAATKRTILFLMRRDEFAAQVLREIDAREKKAAKTGIPAVFRLNGTSDIDFSEIIAARPNSQFYDYTKELGRIRRNTLANYHLTFSGSMNSRQSRAALRKAIAAGFNIAFAFNTKNIARDALKIPAGFVDFDSTDLRFLDRPGSIGALTSKGTNAAHRAALDTRADSFFITSANLGAMLDIITTDGGAK